MVDHRHLRALEAQISPDVDAEGPMIDLTVMGDRKPSMALLDHRGAGVFRAPSERSLRDLVLAPGAFQLQQRASKRARRHIKYRWLPSPWEVPYYDACKDR